MKITKNELRAIIKEELSLNEVLNEGVADWMADKICGQLRPHRESVKERVAEFIDDAAGDLAMKMVPEEWGIIGDAASKALATVIRGSSKAIANCIVDSICPD